MERSERGSVSRVLLIPKEKHLPTCLHTYLPGIPYTVLASLGIFILCCSLFFFSLSM